MKFGVVLMLVCLLFSGQSATTNRGEVVNHQGKYLWSGSGEAFVPNYVMIDVIGKLRNEDNSNNLSLITAEQVDKFIAIYLEEHGFNGAHIPVYGQWFHIGNNKVSQGDRSIDQATFDKLTMIIRKVYEAGGSTHLWLWGDASRSQTSKSLKGGIMGAEEKELLNEIYRQLNPLQGWSISYGFDLWEWVDENQLRAWHDYLWQKDGWNHLIGARASKNKLDQLYEGMDYASYEYHKPWYEELREMKEKRPDKPTFSEDRYRIRTPSKYPKKDYDEEETRRGLWHHTLAGGVAAIWGNLDGTGEYENKEALKCFSVFWNDKKRFKKDMVVDTTLSEAYCLTDNTHLVFYQENTSTIDYRFTGKPKNVIAVDARKRYQEIDLSTLGAGKHTFTAPYPSDWALWLEE
ncbi:hypothetical protein [Tunicatimonas pelagia]|uniref:hypothetical protein n=1 Tax=Tunicatimonas pelagia TaxID=931531 RepID=UPI0026656017|nr:hypothetical protein [Tunicatimonas pelagia]WKN43629.1 hypothetical protein P0M28_01430 [Tunicatimonas pelagia]